MTSHFLYDVDVSFLLTFGSRTFSRKKKKAKILFCYYLNGKIQFENSRLRRLNPYRKRLKQKKLQPYNART